MAYEPPTVNNGPEIKTYYFDEECPVCRTPIPKDACSGSECLNCSHIFFPPQDDDD